MAKLGSKNKITVTERGVLTGLLMREERQNNLTESGEAIETPWYYKYLDSYNSEKIERAHEMKVELDASKADMVEDSKADMVEA